MTDPAAHKPSGIETVDDTPVAGETSARSPQGDRSTHAPHGRLLPLALGALGIVFGDIGTSPLYTLHECVHFSGSPTVRPVDVLGVLSLIFWSLTMVVTVKYLTFIMRADNHGEGGIFALLALIPTRLRTARSGAIGWAAVLVVVGAALLYGDGMITPAISVLSAMEGLEVATPSLRPFVLPLTCAVLVGLFAAQSRGTGKVGAVFGPVMAVWFVTIGGLGVFHVARHPAVLAALSPAYAVAFFAEHGVHGALVLGAVVLAVTGGEALYADMGHFGARPIRVAWLAVVMPALVANYFGQGALMLVDPSARHSPFFAMVPAGGWTYALVVVSAAATVIASQALISGAFSLTHQAVQLGFLPRVKVTHTSQSAEGQIFVPEVNVVLAIACIALVLTFQHSERLAAAYGIAVTGTMAITSIIFFEVTRTTWGWPMWKAVSLLVLFLAFDVPFFVMNLFKFVDGGYVPVVVAAVLCVVMITWNRGRRIYAQRVASTAPTIEQLVAKLHSKNVTRTPGACVFLTARLSGLPLSLVHYVMRLHALPEHAVLLTIDVGHFPYAADEAMRMETLGAGIVRITIDRGFLDVPNLGPLIDRAVARFELPIDCAEVTYCVGRETFLATSAGEMGVLSESLFAFLARNARSAATVFCLNPSQVIEIGSQIDL
jgi:KUP system potassium uptake protein